jgi:hypothetical protein
MTGRRMPPFLVNDITLFLSRAAYLVLLANGAVVVFVVLVRTDAGLGWALTAFSIAGAGTALATWFVTLAAGYCLAWRVHVRQEEAAAANGRPLGDEWR